MLIIEVTSTGKLSIGQYYSLLINPSDYFANSPIITGNRWGIYQAGANDKNYFAANIYNDSKYIQIGGTVSNVSNSFVIDFYNNANYRFQTYNGSDFLIHWLMV